VKITLSQLSFHTGNFAGNTDKIISSIEAAKQAGSELIVFSELATCGYPARDFLAFQDFINQAENSIQKIANHCRGIAAIVGSPRPNLISKGKRAIIGSFELVCKKNCAYFLSLNVCLDK
jgi:NAD+ synthase (glutamine-hydrolysing)